MNCRAAPLSVSQIALSSSGGIPKSSCLMLLLLLAFSTPIFWGSFYYQMASTTNWGVLFHLLLASTSKEFNLSSSTLSSGALLCPQPPINSQQLLVRLVVKCGRLNRQNRDTSMKCDTRKWERHTRNEKGSQGNAKEGKGEGETSTLLELIRSSLGRGHGKDKGDKWMKCHFLSRADRNALTY